MNAVYEETIEKSLYSDDKKIGRLFVQYFGKIVPGPFVALVSATVNLFITRLFSMLIQNY